MSKGVVAGETVLGQTMQGLRGLGEDFGFCFEANRSRWEEMSNRGWGTVGCSKGLYGCALSSPNTPLPPRDASEPEVRERRRESHCRHLPWRPEMFSLVSTRSQGLASCCSGWCSGHIHMGRPCQGLFPRTILGTAFCLSLREGGSCLSDREAQGIGQQSQHTLGLAYKIIFPNTQTLHAPYQASRWQSPVAGQCRFICATSAQRPGRGGCVRSSPICLHKHLRGPPIKVLLFFFGRCLF